jgi:hypothetical protein
MRVIRDGIVICLFAAACAVAQDPAADQQVAQMFVHRAELNSPMGVENGALVMAEEKLVFISDTNPDRTYAIPRTDVRSLTMEGGILNIALRRNVVNEYGRRADVVLRLVDGSSPAVIADWIGLPIHGAPSVSVMGEAARTH